MLVSLSLDLCIGTGLQKRDFLFGWFNDFGRIFCQFLLCIEIGIHYVLEFVLLVHPILILEDFLIVQRVQFESTV